MNTGTMNVTEPGQMEWAASVVVAPKKNGLLRFRND